MSGEGSGAATFSERNRQQACVTVWACRGKCASIVPIFPAFWLGQQLPLGRAVSIFCSLHLNTWEVGATENRSCRCRQRVNYKIKSARSAHVLTPPRS